MTYANCFIPGEEVIHKDTGDEYTVVAVSPCGFGGFMCTLRSRDGHLTAKRPCNLERISPPPLMEANVIAMPRRGWVPQVIEGGRP